MPGNMKYALFLAFITLFTIKSFSQCSRLNVELSHPISHENNFIEEKFNGFIDLGLKYRFIRNNILNLGISANVGIFNNSKKNIDEPLDITANIIQPRLFSEFNIQALPFLHPSVSVGYTYLTFNASGINSFNPDYPEDLNLKTTESGINLNLAIAFDITNRFFLQAQYDFIKLEPSNETPYMTSNDQLHFFKVGIGYRIGDIYQCIYRKR